MGYKKDYDFEKYLFLLRSSGWTVIKKSHQYCDLVKEYDYENLIIVEKKRVFKKILPKIGKEMILSIGNYPN